MAAAAAPPAAGAVLWAAGAARAGACLFAAFLFSVLCFLLLFHPSIVFFTATDSSLAYCTYCKEAARGCSKQLSTLCKHVTASSEKEVRDTSVGAHQVLLKEWKAVHALKGVGGRSNVCEDDPCLAPQFVCFTALNVSDLPKLREEAI